MGSLMEAVYTVCLLIQLPWMVSGTAYLAYEVWAALYKDEE
jgi:hypothetical protein